MKTSIKVTALTVALAIISGCATQPSNVAATHVSSLKYDSVECKRLALEASEVEAKLSATTASLQTKANTDAVLVGVGAIIFWPALLGTAATGGKAEEQELARLKGEKIAIEQASLIKNCGVTIKDPSASSDAKPTNSTPTKN